MRYPATEYDLNSVSTRLRRTIRKAHKCLHFIEARKITLARSALAMKGGGGRDTLIIVLRATAQWYIGSATCPRGAAS